MNRVCIAGAARTPHGRFMGGLAKRSAVDLAVAAGEAALGSLGRRHVDSVVVGNVLGAGLGMNIARQIGVRLALPIETPAFTVNMMCGSGLQAVLLAEQAIRAGDARCVVCGGTESMSNAPYLLDRARGGYKFGDAMLVDSVLRDGLTDPFGHGHMGDTAERLAKQFDVAREAQDAYAAQSQRRYAAAHSGGRIAREVVPVDGVANDEPPRPDTTPEKLAALKPAFRADGTVTAGNASGINDGAAMLVLCDERFAAEHALRPLAYVSGGASVGCDPATMGLGPVHAIRKLCDRLRTTPGRFDLIELNEAFAAQALACIRQLELDPARVNRDGGAIAIGHPIGASGARLAVHLAHRLAAGDGRHALASLCVGGGMGISLALQA